MKSRLCRVKDWAERAKEAKYTVEVLASNCGSSVTELERFFQSVMKMPPHRWMTELRHFQAKAELQEGIPIKRVAFGLGYKSVPHFSREFKKVHHTTPAAIACGTAAQTHTA